MKYRYESRTHLQAIPGANAMTARALDIGVLVAADMQR
jgi:hypothetical protein